jgi:hypothetical protein
MSEWFGSHQRKGQDKVGFKRSHEHALSIPGGFTTSPFCLLLIAAFTL